MNKDCRVCKYIWNILIAFDQLCNTIIAGDPDETMSSRFGKWSNLNQNNPESTIKKVIAKLICFVLNKIDKDHCHLSIEEDEGKDDLLK